MTREGGREREPGQVPHSGDEHIDHETLLSRYGEAMLRIGQLESRLQEMSDELRLKQRQEVTYAPSQYQYTQGLPYLEQKIVELQRAIDGTVESKETVADTVGETTEQTKESQEMRQLRIQISNLSGQLAITDEQLAKMQGDKSRRHHRGAGSTEGGNRSRKRSRSHRSFWKRIQRIETYQGLLNRYRYVGYAAVIAISLVSAVIIAQTVTQSPQAPTGNERILSDRAQGASVISDIKVQSTVPWNSTSVIVSNTDIIEVVASGLVAYKSDGSSSPDGETPHGVWQNASDNTNRGPWMAPLLPGQSLIAKIGSSGEPFYVGRHSVVRPGEAGELFLALNEESSGGRGDNAGSWNVEVRVTGCCAGNPERIPIELKAAPSENGRAINLSWKRPQGDLLGYKVFRGGPGVLGTEVGEIGRDVTEFVMPSSSGGTICAFVRPFDAGGLRIASEQQCVGLSDG